MIRRLRWWWNARRYGCPLGPPPACPPVEEYTIDAITTCVTVNPTPGFIGRDGVHYPPVPNDDEEA